MKIRFLIFVMLLFLLTSNLCRAADPAKNYELLSIWQRNALTVLPMEVNAETPGDEIVGIFPNQIDVYSNLNLQHQKSFIIPVDRHYILLPGTSPDSLHLLVGYYTPTTAAFDLYVHSNDKMSLVKEGCFFFSGQDRDRNGRFHQSLWPLNEIVLDRNGRQKVIIRIDSGGDAGTRGLAAIDPLTGNTEWQYLAGPLVLPSKQADLDGDNRAEIIFGSYAQDNGVNLNGTRDDSAYVFVLDDLGNARWRKTFGPYWTGAIPIVGDMTGDDKNELVVYRYGTNPKFKNFDELIRLDPTNGTELQRKKVGHAFTANLYAAFNLCYDFDGDGIKEFVIGSTDGFVRMYRGDLSVMYSSEPYRRPITVYGIGDLDGDRMLELVCMTADRQLVILNHQLKQLLTQQMPPNAGFPVLIRLEHKHQILIAERIDDKTASFRIFDFHAVGFVQTVRHQGQNYLIGLLLLAVLIFSVAMIRNSLYGKRAFRLLLQILEQTQVLDNTLILKHRQQLLRLGQNWASLLQVFPHQVEGKNWPDILINHRHQTIGAAIEKMLTEKLSCYDCLYLAGTGNPVPLRIKAFYISWVKAHCFMLFDSSEQEHIRQVKHWAAVAQRLAHGIKNPLTTVKLNAEELLHQVRTKNRIQKAEVEEFVTPIITQVSKLKKMTDGFMRFVEFEQPVLKPVDLNREIKELIPQWQPGKTSQVQIDWELEENLPPAMIDPRQFEHVIKNVFYNALESISDEGRILISTRKVQVFSDAVEGGVLSNFIELEIRDTGCGIPPEYLDRIKQPYFSYNKPEGTGLGLSIVQKIMDSHGGQFEVESEVKVGTTVSLRFKQANNN